MENDRYNRAPFFQNQAETIFEQWETFKEDFEDEEGLNALVDWEIDAVWDIFMDRLRIDKTQIDCHNPNLLPGFADNFAIFNDFCRLRDPAFYADHRNAEYIDWVKENPEAFFTIYYQYLDRPQETRTNYRNGKPAIQKVIFMINNRDALIYTNPLQACKHDLVEQSGSAQKLKNEFSAVVPYEWYGARTTRLVNAYGGYDWVESARKGIGQYAEMQRHVPTWEASEFKVEIQIPSKAIVGEASECLDCGAWTNPILKEVITKAEADEIQKRTESEEQKKKFIISLMSERAEAKLKAKRVEIAANKKKKSIQRRERYIDKIEKQERVEENRTKRALLALDYLLPRDIETIKTDEEIFSAIELKAFSKPGTDRIRKAIKTVLNSWDYLSEACVKKLEDLLVQYETTFTN